MSAPTAPVEYKTIWEINYDGSSERFDRAVNDLALHGWRIAHVIQPADETGHGLILVRQLAQENA